MRDLLHRKHRLLALLCMSLGACSDTGGSDGDGSRDGEVDHDAATATDEVGDYANMQGGKALESS